MRLLRCLIMILATLSLAGVPASASGSHGQATLTVAPHHHHHPVDVASDQADHEVIPCAGHHGPKSHHDGRCCGMACCGPSFYSPATAMVTGFRAAFTIVSRRIPSADALVDGTPYSLPDRPPIAG